MKSMSFQAFLDEIQTTNKEQKQENRKYADSIIEQTRFELYPENSNGQANAKSEKPKLLILEQVALKDSKNLKDTFEIHDSELQKAIQEGNAYLAKLEEYYITQKGKIPIDKDPTLTEGQSHEKLISSSSEHPVFDESIEKIKRYSEPAGSPKIEAISFNEDFSLVNQSPKVDNENPRLSSIKPINEASEEKINTSINQFEQSLEEKKEDKGPFSEAPIEEIDANVLSELKDDNDKKLIRPNSSDKIGNLMESVNDVQNKPEKTKKISKEEEKVLDNKALLHMLEKMLEDSNENDKEEVEDMILELHKLLTHTNGNVLILFDLCIDSTKI